MNEVFSDGFRVNHLLYRREYMQYSSSHWERGSLEAVSEDPDVWYDCASNNTFDSSYRSSAKSITVPVNVPGKASANEGFGIFSIFSFDVGSDLSIQFASHNSTAHKNISTAPI